MIRAADTRIQRRMLLLGVLGTAAALTGCSADGVQAPASTAEPSAVVTEAPEPAATVDPVARKAVESWLETAVMPDGAVRLEEAPEDAQFLSHQGWVCAPMALATGYWTVGSSTLVDAYNWLVDHPVPGMISLGGRMDASSEHVDAANLGNVPEQGALEGIAFEIVHLEDGVAIRAEAGAFTDGTVCPTPEPGTQFGSPGEG